MALVPDALLEDPDDRIPSILNLGGEMLSAEKGASTCEYIQRTLAAGRPVVVYGTPMSQEIELTESSFGTLRRDLDSMIEVQGKMGSYASLSSSTKHFTLMYRRIIIL